jgi:hypothetical protein
MLCCVDFGDRLKFYHFDGVKWALHAAPLQEGRGLDDVDIKNFYVFFGSQERNPFFFGTG